MRRPRLQCLFCFSLGLAVLAGCESNLAERREQAMVDLRFLVDGVPTEARLLAFETPPEGDAAEGAVVAKGFSYWCVIAETEPTPISERPVKSVEFPAGALLSFATQVGVDASDLGEPTEQTGRFYEWPVEHQGQTLLVRLRHISTTEGVLAVIESTPQ